MDLEAKAAANSVVWGELAKAACRGDAAVARFRLAAGNSAVGTNVTPAKLSYFRRLQPPAIVSTYEFRRARDGETQATADVYDAGEWGPRRRAFEEGIDAFGTVVYGTLDLPNCPGDDRYGPYRLCFVPARDADAFVLPHNSGLKYVVDSTFASDLFERDVARWADRGEVACAQKAGHSRINDESQWPLLLADEDAVGDLVEVFLPEGGRRLTEVTAIRVSRATFDAYLRSSADFLAGQQEAKIELAADLANQLADEADRGVTPLVEV